MDTYNRYKIMVFNRVLEQHSQGRPPYNSASSDEENQSMQINIGVTDVVSQTTQNLSQRVEDFISSNQEVLVSTTTNEPLGASQPGSREGSIGVYFGAVNTQSTGFERQNNISSNDANASDSDNSLISRSIGTTPGSLQSLYGYEIGSNLFSAPISQLGSPAAASDTTNFESEDQDCDSLPSYYDYDEDIREFNARMRFSYSGPPLVQNLPSRVRINPTNYIRGNPYNSNAIFNIGNEIFYTEWEFLEAYSHALDQEYLYSSDSELSTLSPVPFLSQLRLDEEDDIEYNEINMDAAFRLLQEAEISSDDSDCAILLDHYDSQVGRIYEAAAGSGEGTIPGHGATSQDAEDGENPECSDDGYEQFPDGSHTPEYSEDGDFCRMMWGIFFCFFEGLFKVIMTLNKFVIYNFIIFFITSVFSQLTMFGASFVYPLLYSLAYVAGIRNFFIGIMIFSIHRICYHLLFCPTIYICYLFGSKLVGHRVIFRVLLQFALKLDSWSPGSNTRQVVDFLKHIHGVNTHIDSNNSDDTLRVDDEFGFLAKSLCIPKQYDRFFSSLFLLITSFDNAKNNKGRAAACVSFIMHQSEGGIVTMAESTATFLKCFYLAFPGKVQPAASFDELDAFLTGLTKLSISDRYVGVVNLISLLSCSVLFGSSTLGAFANSHNFINRDVQKAAQGMSTDRLFIDIAKSVLNLLRSFVGTPKEAGYVTNTAQLHATIYELMSNIKNRGLTEQSPGMPVEVFCAKLMACDKFIFNFLMSNPSSAAKIAMGSAIKEVQNLNAMFRRSAMDTARNEPFNIYLTGAPGVGKTELAIRLAIAAMVKLGYKNPTAANIYFKNGSKWWDGYDPTKHWCVIIDEIANLKHCPAGDAANMEAYTGLLAMLSSSQYLTEQAESFNKCAMPFMAGVVICMSNRIDLGAPHYLESLLAFYRRANVMCNVVSVKPQFAKGAVIDHTKVPVGERNIVNIHLIEMDATCHLHPKTRGDNILVLNNDELVYHVTAMSQKHAEKIVIDNERRSHILPVKMEDLQVDLDKMLYLAAGPSDIVISGWQMLSVCASCTSRIIAAHILIFFLTTASSALSVFIEDERNTRHNRIRECFTPTIVKARSIWRGVNDLGGDTWKLAHEFQRQTMKDYSKYTTYVGIFSGIVSAAIVYNWVKSRDDKEEEKITTEAGGVAMGKAKFNVLEIGSPPKPPPVSAMYRNIWAKSEHYLPWGQSSANFRDLDAKILRATYAIAKGTGPTSIMMNALNVRGQFYMVPIHFKLSQSETPGEIITLLRYVPRPGDGKECDLVVVWQGYVLPVSAAVVTDDTQLVEIMGTSPGKDLFPYFLKKQPSSPYKIKFTSQFYAPYRVYAKLDRDGGELLNDSGELSIGKVVVSNPLDADKISEYHAFRGESEVICYPGRCGTSALIHDDKHGAIGGILIAGVFSQKHVVFSIVTLENLEKAYGILTHEYEMPSGVEMAGALVPYGVNLVDPTRSHHLHYVPTHPFIFHGVVEKATGSSMTSNVVIHPAHERIRQIFNFKNVYAAPKFGHGRTPEGKYISQEGHLLNDLINHSQNVSPSLLQHARYSMLDKFIDKGKKGIVKIYDIRTAVNGASYIALNGINKNAGVGFPWPGKKGEYLVLSPTKENPLSVMPNDLILSEMDYMLGEFLAGRRVNNVMLLSFKDEAMKKAKADEFKNRAFSGCGTALLILMRMYMGPMLDVISKDPARFETVAGINVFSSQWKERYVDLLRFPNGISGDYKRYDKSMPSFIQQEAYMILLACAQWYYDDWTEEDSKVFMGLACESMYPVYLVDACLIEVAGSVPSGILLTLIINGMCQGILHRISYSLMVSPLLPFNDNVVLLTMGDDSSMSVSDDVFPQFNLISNGEIQKLFGVTLTASSKESGDAPGHPISESNICKRSIRVDEESGMTMCPIEWESINKMITTVVKGGPLSVEQKFAASYEAAIQEFAMYGRETYDLYVPKLLGLADEFGYRQFMEHILSYETILERFRNASLAPHVIQEE